MNRKYKNIKSIMLLAGCLIASVNVYSFQFDDKFDTYSEWNSAKQDDNILLHSDITYMEMYNPFVSANTFNTENASTEEDIEIGGVKRESPIHGKLYFFILLGIIYGIRLFSNKKRGKSIYHKA